VNIVLGANASGKTALLEALFLALGPSPEIAQRFKIWRGYQPALLNLTREADKQIWADIFNDFDLSKEIRVRADSDDHHSRELKINYDLTTRFSPTPESAAPIQFGNIGGGFNFFPSPIVFTYSAPGRMPWEVRANFVGGGYQFVGVEQDHISDSAFFPAAQNFNAQENVERYSRLSKNREASGVVELISREFEFITGVEVFSGLGGLSALYIDSPWYSEKRPLSSISTGVQKFVTFILSISANRGGVMFIDEIENGFYYDRLPSIWSSLIDLANRYDVQIFASTHSRECLEALKLSAAPRVDDVSFIRTEAARDGMSIEQFSGASAFRAMELGEIR
jgi:predicted ATPase